MVQTTMQATVRWLVTRDGLGSYDAWLWTTRLQCDSGSRDRGIEGHESLRTQARTSRSTDG